MRDHWDNEDWAEVEDMDETATSKGLKQSVVVLAETLTDEEEVSGDVSGFKDTVTQLTKTLESFKSSFDDTLKELQRLNKKMDEERKQKTLERALILTDLDSFDYYLVELTGKGYERYSSDLAKGVIGRFMLGQSAKLPSAMLSEDSYEWYKKTIKEKDTLVKKFVDKFVYQISILTGKQPRIVKVGDMLYDIHYE
jgi:DNA gyrase/topoisomerase IV subunit A